ncbi:MAG: hypothetical protein JRJ59_06520 [Deltaproteobacteria bacterium]|nr:hypothetical protein [Deltaproteobacteria bacterium]
MSEMIRILLVDDEEQFVLNSARLLRPGVLRWPPASTAWPPAIQPAAVPGFMITRKKIKQAIGAISQRDPEAGYSLKEMLGMGRIDPPRGPDQAPDKDHFSFLFENQAVLVPKFQYFSAVSAALEQRLLIKYGELARRQELAQKKGFSDFRRAALDMRQAGLRFLVDHEIEHALSGLRKKLGPRPGSAPDKDLLSLLEKIRAE